MQVKKIAEEVVELFRKQEQQVGDVYLLSIKVSLPNSCNADEVAKYIVTKYPYKAHSKNEGEEQILAIGHNR